MNKQRIAVLVASSVGLLSFFLPWVSIPIYGSMNGADGERSWFIFGAFLIAIVLSLVGNRKKHFDNVTKYIIAALGVVAIVLSLLQIGDIMSANTATSLIRAEIGIGLYLEVIAGAAVSFLAITTSLFVDKNTKPKKRNK